MRAVYPTAPARTTPPKAPMSRLTLYSPAILDHARSPRHEGRGQPGAQHVRHHNPICGDRVDLWLHAQQLTHHTRGCAVCIASASMLTEAFHTHAAPEQLVELGSQLVDPAGPSFENTPWQVLTAVRDVPMRADCVQLPFRALAELLAVASALPGS